MVEIFLFSLRWIETSGSKIIITILLIILNRLTVLINRSHLITVSVIMIINCVLISFLRYIVRNSKALWSLIHLWRIGALHFDEIVSLLCILLNFLLVLLHLWLKSVSLRHSKTILIGYGWEILGGWRSLVHNQVRLRILGQKLLCELMKILLIEVCAGFSVVAVCARHVRLLSRRQVLWLDLILVPLL